MDHLQGSLQRAPPQDHVGVVHSSNLCTEITLNTSNDETAVCNLGSVILDQHLDKDGNIDHKKLKETVRTAIRALDNVIDINYYPTEAAKRSNQAHRPIGLGVMGLQNALYIRDIPFASQEAVEFNDEAMEAIAYYAIEASSDLAGERGGLLLVTRDRNGIADCFPQDTFDILEEERGQHVDVPRGGKLDWEPVRKKIAKQGTRIPTSWPSLPRQPFPTSPAHPLYRAGLQEPLRQEQPLRGIHHSQPAPGTRPQSSRALEQGYAQQPEVLLMASSTKSKRSSKTSS